MFPNVHTAKSLESSTTLNDEGSALVKANQAQQHGEHADVSIESTEENFVAPSKVLQIRLLPVEVRLQIISLLPKSLHTKFLARLFDVKQWDVITALGPLQFYSNIEQMSLSIGRSPFPIVFQNILREKGNSGVLNRQVDASLALAEKMGYKTSPIARQFAMKVIKIPLNAHQDLANLGPNSTEVDKSTIIKNIPAHFKSFRNNPAAHQSYCIRLALSLKHFNAKQQLDVIKLLNQEMSQAVEFAHPLTDVKQSYFNIRSLVICTLMGEIQFSKSEDVQREILTTLLDTLDPFKQDFYPEVKLMMIALGKEIPYLRADWKFNNHKNIQQHALDSFQHILSNKNPHISVNADDKTTIITKVVPSFSQRALVLKHKKLERKIQQIFNSLIACKLPVILNRTKVQNSMIKSMVKAIQLNPRAPENWAITLTYAILGWETLIQAVPTLSETAQETVISGFIQQMEKMNLSKKPTTTREENQVLIGIKTFARNIEFYRSSFLDTYNELSLIIKDIKNPELKAQAKKHLDEYEALPKNMRVDENVEILYDTETEHG